MDSKTKKYTIWGLIAAPFIYISYKFTKLALPFKFLIPLSMIGWGLCTIFAPSWLVFTTPALVTLAGLILLGGMLGK